MKTFSIVIPTIGRKKELEKLLESIKQQNYKKIEVIIVDQNQDNRLIEVVKKYKPIFTLKHYKVKFKGASKARNYGAQKASGEIINFPDDDCIYEKNTLKKVSEIFTANNNIDALFGKVKDQENKKDILYFKKSSGKVKKSNIYKTTIETSMFIKLKIFKEIEMFDENLGVGTYFGAEEGADLVCRLLYKNYNLQYIADNFFFHPNKKEEENIKRAYSYGIGFGGMAYKHIIEYKKIYPAILYLIMKIGKNIFCIIYGIITINTKKIRYNYYSLKGKMVGILKSNHVRKERRKDGSNNFKWRKRN